MANGDVQLPKPPPWAYPLWSRHETQNYETDRMLKSTSQVIDQAMAQLWETKVKFVNVSFSIEKLGRSRSIALSETGRRLRHDATDSHDSPADSQIVGDQPIEWVKVTLSAVPGVNMEDVDDNEPTRKKDHRRVPSTIAIEEVKVSLTFEFISLVSYFWYQLIFFPVPTLLLRLQLALITFSFYELSYSQLSDCVIAFRNMQPLSIMRWQAAMASNLLLCNLLC